LRNRLKGVQEKKYENVFIHELKAYFKYRSLIIPI